MPIRYDSRGRLAAMLALTLWVFSVNLSFASGKDDDDHNDVDDKPVATELSVAPSDHREYPEGRPEWIDAAPNMTETIHRWPVSSGPCRTQSLAKESLAVNLRAAVETYAETITGASDAGSIINLEESWINQRLDRTKDYTGTIKEGDETLFESATELKFTTEDQATIKHLWQQHLVSQRFAALGMVGTGLVVLLVGSAAGLSVVTRRAEKRVTAEAGLLN